jgi:hypothetical protein
MANYFVDSTTGDNGDDGTTMDLAWATLEYALVSGGLSAGDTVWVRRVHSETPTAIIQVGYSGTAESPIKVIGWPRAAESSISSATWTNGSTTVDLIVGLSMDREKHLGRFITGPDGFDYLITKITDSNTILIDREYAGVTVTGANGVATIKADEDWYDNMGTQYSFDDSGWTIKEADWDADADDLPTWDFSTAGNYYLYHNQDHFCWYANLNVIGSTYSAATLYFRSTSCVLQGVLLHTDINGGTIQCTNGFSYFNRVVVTATYVGSNQTLGIASGKGVMRNSSVGGLYAALKIAGVDLYLENVNLGIEVADAALDIWYNYAPSIVRCRDVRFGGSGSNGDVGGNLYTGALVDCENFGKSLGAHKSFTSKGSVVNTAVVDGSGDPYKRTGGADEVLEILFDNTDTTDGSKASINEWVDPIFTHEFEATTDNRKYRYYVQAEGAVLASELWMEVEYVKSHDDTSEYTITKLTSDQAISARVDASDWSQYLEVINVNPALASKVRIKIYCSYYHATNKIYIDPLPEVTV